MRWTRASSILLLLVGCSATPARAPVPTAPANDTDALEALATDALKADARLDPADTLFTAEVEVIAEGMRRTGVPRFAGIEAGGQVVLGSIRIDQAGNFAWASFDYRWLAGNQEQFHEGWATLVFTRIASSAGASWRIAQLHSSLRQ